MKQNKLVISSFDLKHFLIFDENSAVLFGHKAVEENDFLEDIYVDTEWANLYSEADNSSPEFQFSDWGFQERPYSETELREEEASSSRVCERPFISNRFFLSEVPKKNI